MIILRFLKMTEHRMFKQDQILRHDQLIIDKVYNWVLAHGPGIIMGLAIYFLGRWLIKIFGKWFTAIIFKRLDNHSIAPFLQSLTITLLQLLLIVLCMQIIGVQMTLFAAGTASLGVAIGLALSGTLQNFACGVLILLLKPFKVDDIINAQGQEGVISSIQIFYTIMTTWDNKSVIIPNSKLSNELIINLSSRGKRRLNFLMKFPYTSDADKIKQVIEKTIDNAGVEVLKDPPHQIGVSSFDIDGYVLDVQVWVDPQKYNDAKSIFQLKMLSELKSSELR
jgi:small conductance mechanosensitive channel